MIGWRVRGFAAGIGGRGTRRRAGGFSGAIARAIAGVFCGILVGGILRGGPVEADFHRHVQFVDFVDLAIGLEARGDDLKGDGVAEWDHGNRNFAILAGFELECAFVLVTLNGVKNDMSVGNGLAVVGADDSNTNRGGRRRRLIFATMVRVVVLGAEGENWGDK